MESQILDEFIKYAKEQYGYDIDAKESLASDSFASILVQAF